MDCPACGHWDSLVDDSRGYASHVWRRRVCQRCEHTFDTTECVAAPGTPRYVVNQEPQRGA